MSKKTESVILGEEIMAELGSGQSHVASRWLPTPVGRVLEMGCSSGYLTHHYRHRAERMVGLDLNFKALFSNRRRSPEMPLVCADAERLPFADSSFDAVVMLEVIEHTGSDKAALEEIRRVLRVGGTLILSTPHAGLFAFLDPHNLRKSLQRMLPQLCNAAGRLARFESGQFTENLEYHRHYRLDELSALLGKDFSVREVYRGGLLLYPVVAGFISVVARLCDRPSLLRWMFRTLNWDFHLSYGPLSYNLMILAERVR